MTMTVDTPPSTFSTPLELDRKELSSINQPSQSFALLVLLHTNALYPQVCWKAIRRNRGIRNLRSPFPLASMSVPPSPPYPPTNSRTYSSSDDDDLHAFPTIQARQPQEIFLNSSSETSDDYSSRQSYRGEIIYAGKIDAGG